MVGAAVSWFRRLLRRPEPESPRPAHPPRPRKPKADPLRRSKHFDAAVALEALAKQSADQLDDPSVWWVVEIIDPTMPGEIPLLFGPTSSALTALELVDKTIEGLNANLVPGEAPYRGRARPVFSLRGSSE